MITTIIIIINNERIKCSLATFRWTREEIGLYIIGETARRRQEEADKVAEQAWMADLGWNGDR